MCDENIKDLCLEPNVYLTKSSNWYYVTITTPTEVYIVKDC